MSLAWKMPGRLRWLSAAMCSAAACVIVLSVFCDYFIIDFYFDVGALMNGTSAQDGTRLAVLEAKEAFINRLATARIAVGVGTLVVWFAWLYNSAKLLRMAGIKGLTHSPAMTIVWHFIPVMQLWKPLHINVEIANASLGIEDWERAPPPKLAVAASFLSVVTGLITKAYFAQADEIETLTDSLSLIRFGGVVDVFLVSSMIMTIFFVRQIAQRQKTLLARLVPPSSADVTPHHST